MTGNHTAYNFSKSDIVHTSKNFVKPSKINNEKEREKAIGYCKDNLRYRYTETQIYIYIYIYIIYIYIIYIYIYIIYI